MSDLNDQDKVNGNVFDLADLEKYATPKNKKAGAKEYSLLGQIFAAIWIVVWSALKFYKGIANGQEVEVTDIIYSGIAIAACFSPVYVSILFDKIKAIRFGDK